MSSISTISTVKRIDRLNPSNKWDTELEDEIKRAIRSSLSLNENISTDVFSRFRQHYEAPCSNMAQLRKQTKKESGNLWEHFCLMYLKAKGYGECWLIADVPKDILEKLNLTRKDMGIDIVVKHEKNGFFAVQAKYRSNKKNTATISLTWNSLSTFYALCARSGPWLKFIVITNCDYVRRAGKKYVKDQTIANGSFKKCPRDIWQQIAGLSEGHSLEPIQECKSTSTKQEHNTKREVFLAKLEMKCKQQ